jgi:predicted HTH domain antitoxin
MKNLNLQIPDSIDLSINDLKIFIAVKIYEAGKLSIEQAAVMAELSISDFMDTLFAYNISIFNYSASELKSDINNAEESIS